MRQRPPGQHRAAATNSTNVTTADLDKDGSPDLLSSGSDSSNPGKVMVFLNDGTGAFEPPVGYDTQVFTRSVVVADFNQDTHLDFAAIAQNSSLIRRFFGDSSGAFTATATVDSTPPISIDSGDIDEDSSPDVVLRENGAPQFSLFLDEDDGSGDFEAPTTRRNSPSATSMRMGSSTWCSLVRTATSASRSSGPEPRSISRVVMRFGTIEGERYGGALGALARPVLNSVCSPLATSPSLTPTRSTAARAFRPTASASSSSPPTRPR